MVVGKCEICGGDFGKDINILPIIKPNGCYNTLACNKCARTSEAFCNIHKRPHLGFIDGTTACKQCIDGKVINEAGEIFKKFSEGIENSPKKETILKTLAKYKISLEGIGAFAPQQSLVRVIVTFALRKKKEIDDVIKKILKEGLDEIIPKDIFNSPSN